MKGSTGIAIAFVLGIAIGGLGLLAWDAKNDPAPVTSREQDSLKVVIGQFEHEQRHWAREKDSILSRLDSVVKHRPTIEVVRERNTRYLDSASANELRAILLRKYKPRSR